MHRTVTQCKASAFEGPRELFTPAKPCQTLPNHDRYVLGGPAATAARTPDVRLLEASKANQMLSERVISQLKGRVEAAETKATAGREEYAELKHLFDAEEQRHAETRAALATSEKALTSMEVQLEAALETAQISTTTPAAEAGSDHLEEVVLLRERVRELESTLATSMVRMHEAEQVAVAEAEMLNALILEDEKSSASTELAVGAETETAVSVEEAAAVEAATAGEAAGMAAAEAATAVEAAGMAEAEATTAVEVAEAAGMADVAESTTAVEVAEAAGMAEVAESTNTAVEDDQLQDAAISISRRSKS